MTVGHTNHQIINHKGKPVAVVIPYDEYKALINAEITVSQTAATDEQVLIPHEVVGYVLKHGFTQMRAWREYLGMTQEEVASRAGLKQPSYARMESGNAKVRIATLKRIAKAMNIQSEQLHLDDIG